MVANAYRGLDLKESLDAHERPFAMEPNKT